MPEVTKDDPTLQTYLGLFQEIIGGVSRTGVLPSQMLKDLVATNRIVSEVPITDEQIQPASLDLRLGSRAYRVQASFLPGARSTVREKMQSITMAEMDLTEGAILERGCVYIIPLQEVLDFPHELHARANPRSTTGRLDVFTRLITDYGQEFEYVRPGYKGPLFAEVSPRTFTIRVQTGMRLNQLRVLRGTPPSADAKLVRLDEEEGLVFIDEEPVRAEIAGGLKLSVRLGGETDDEVIAYKAKRNAQVVDLAAMRSYEISEFWEVIRGKRDSLILEPSDFYILGSREKVRVPPGYAAEMIPFDPSIGEFRIHYAGFFDPGFGYGSGERIKGTRAVLEVRAHEVPFMIESGQMVGRLLYTPLLRTPEKIYGAGIGSSYQLQGLALSRQFKR